MTIIESHGNWDWSLTVEDDGVVRASRPKRYDGVLVYSTENRPNRTSQRSEYRLPTQRVVWRYVQHSDTTRSVDELMRSVLEAKGVLDQ